MAIKREVWAGQAVYSKALLAVYDHFVLGVSNRLIWKCPTSHLLKLYDRHISPNHLDIGVGTGFFLDRCAFSAHPRLILVDLNTNSLEVTAKRIRRYHPKAYRRNILEPLMIEEHPFDSIGMNYLLHCLPGAMQTKAIVFDHIYPYLKPGGTVFGSTLLQGGVQRSLFAKALMRLYNKKGIFCNEGDDLESLRKELKNRFPESCVEIAGCACAALFWACK